MNSEFKGFYRHHSLLDRVVTAHKNDEVYGITSICSANPYVLEASLLHAKAREMPVLIESTCNQVNQFGGYTGMTPTDFVQYVRGMAERNEFPLDQIILGGDHLGPNPWKDQSADQAMEHACQLVHDCVEAGYFKIHLDASMHCGDDPSGEPLPIEVAAHRAVQMARVAEDTFKKRRLGALAPRYVIGTEVPPPGGIQDESGETQLEITPKYRVQEMIDITRQAFHEADLDAAWERVIAVVVQPGVEYGDEIIYEYDPERAVELSRFITDCEGLIYEAHSTDYQTRSALRQLVQDHFAILKVGPALTFAFREAVFALTMIEEELFAGRDIAKLSDLRAVLETAMQANPKHWQTYYSGDEHQQHLARKFSFSDRSRYYWAIPEVQEALNTLLGNFADKPIPLTLLSQYFPEQYDRVREHGLDDSPQTLIADKISSVLADYDYGCGMTASI